jgi:thiamine-phosphate pyrophosphorylase
MAASYLYYITDRSAFEGDELSRRRQLLAKVAEAARAGVDFIQLREKDMSARDLEDFAQQALQAIHAADISATGRTRTRLLINSRTDVALAVHADGVHMRANDVSVTVIREIWARAAAAPDLRSKPFISVSCHTEEEAAQAASAQADLVLFAPVFGKKDSPATPAGIDALHRVCRLPVAVVALGGITMQNARLCLAAGAAGVAGIRLFQEHSVEEVTSRLRG